MTETRLELPVLDFETIGPALGACFPGVRLPDQTGAIVDLHERRGQGRALIVFHRSAKW